MVQKILFIVCCVLCTHNVLLAQNPILDSTKLDKIDINHADSLFVVKTENSYYNRLIGNVVVVHKNMTLTCDSAYVYMDEKKVEAYGNVNIVNNNSTCKADFIKYNGNTNLTNLKGNVQIIDGSNTLFTDILTYNIKTKIGNYTNGGTLQAENTTVNSNQGTYNGFTKWCHFTDDVIITNDEYTITSNELTYNTDSKIIQFLDWSEIVTANAVINTKKGVYNAKTQKANFTSRTKVENETQTIEANYLDFDNKNGSGNGRGNVVIIDTAKKTFLFCDQIYYNKQTGFSEAKTNIKYFDTLQHTELYCQKLNNNKFTGYSEATTKVKYIDTVNKIELRCNKLQYNDNSGFIQATLNPKLLSVLENDSMFLRADSIIAYPSKYAKDIKYIKRNKEFVYNLLYADSTYTKPDSTEKRIILCNKNVKLYSDSSQAVCDSLLYNQTTEKFSLYKNPIFWHQHQQASADTMYIFTIDQKINKTLQLKNALIVNDQEKNSIYDQIAGYSIESFFVDGDINKTIVNKNAESIYYAKDDANAYIGMNKAEGAMLEIYFENKEVIRIKFIENPKGDFLPMNELNDSNRYLQTFKLYTDKKPKSKWVILND